ncbi:MAG TPA: CcoQ/FixQ family Cbb3-type cytochrome c oxidase assembly chaperone [Acetobacteraceae bacterium]|jgi:cbb3-type cytochrome oxidase subunit 3|nr:CcoQ/FixQ family Cbb3-type cytochrome c oxidase assembly chaperone [Acetobacteraceae bacterium]
MSTSQWLEHYLVVVLAIVFVGIVAVTYWPGRKAKIEQQGRIPFEDDV